MRWTKVCKLKYSRTTFYSAKVASFKRCKILNISGYLPIYLSINFSYTYMYVKLVFFWTKAVLFFFCMILKVSEKMSWGKKVAQKISMWCHKNEGLSISFLGVSFPLLLSSSLIFMTSEIFERFSPLTKCLQV